MSHASAAQIVRELLEGPVTRPALLRWRRRQFLAKAGTSLYFGVFDSFAAARERLPPSPEFNNEQLATEYVEVRTRQVFAYDYPVMWWLERAFRGGATSVLDIGGSVGVHYHAYRRYFEMPSNLTWHIIEVPAMVSIGCALAAARGVKSLSFTDDLNRTISSADADIWLSAGALHYLEDARPADLLKRCFKQPMHLLLNKLPLCAGEDFVTTQNIGEGCFAPMHVFNGDRLIREVEAQGYTLRDRWKVYERSLYVPGHPERSFPFFTGLYFAGLANETR
ncbi:methyltransferase, TIGR04325 family [Variovorax sp. J22R24]|uniref:methyltransferase, TIGR04325 family n=1 Tax=Variovorax gracilis TaxID=3053502 RepID=UPI002576ED5D|nr:methyltransferase, TIGR04325 family [Variovorax sp. J22R24]MDM0107640.1 methyltransferase, TIGR04325 family [Variovorax sp. J22R24]